MYTRHEGKRIASPSIPVQVERVETGGKPVDTLLNGGIEKEVITNVFGASGTGKTNLCVQAAASVAKDGGRVVYIDTEKGFSPERFVQIADEDSLDNIEIIEPLTFEEQEEAVERLDEMEFDFLVVDSLVSLYRLERNGDAKEVNQRLSDMLSQLSRLAREREIPVMVTNQVYSNFDEDGVELVGRDVPRYWCKCLLKLEREGNSLRKAVIEKHRSLPEGKAVRFQIADKGVVETEEKGLF